MNARGPIAIVIITLITHLPLIKGAGLDDCNLTLTSPTGSILSPNYPQPYPPGVVCQWHITLGAAPNVSGVTLAFKQYSTQTTNSARLFEEELLIYEENPSDHNSTAPVVYRGNGSVFHSHRNELWLRFTSANVTTTTTSSVGFDILYSAVIRDESCQSLDTPPYSTRVGNTTFVGSYVEFKCDSGYRRVGAKLILCVLSSGTATWSDAVPSCVDTCTTPSITNGNAVYPSLTVNVSVTFTCNPPYILSGSGVLRCSSNIRGPSWSGSFPVCVVPDCSEVTTLTGDSGALVNPGYDTHVLLANKYCQWDITVKTGSIIQLSFRYFQLPSDGNTFIQISNVVGSEKKPLLTLQGGDTGRNVSSTSNHVEVIYQAPALNTTHHAGFYLQYAMGSAAALGESHGSLPPIQPSRTTPAPSTTPKVKVSYVPVADTATIVVGVAVPVVILLAIIIGLYLWYRKKYPVRMIRGRKFANFSNPEYNTAKGHSTLTLVREDADDFFKTASRTTSHVNLVMDEEQGPHYVNVAFRNSNGSIHEDLSQQSEVEPTPLDPDEADAELMKRKSYLFTSMNDQTATKKDGGESSSSDSGSETGSRGGGDAPDNVVNVEDKQETDSTQESSGEKEGTLGVSQADIDDLHSKFPIAPMRHTSVDVLLQRSKDRRAFTNEEPVRRFSFDTTMSARGRSMSATTPAEVSKEAAKLDEKLHISNIHQVTDIELKEEDSTSVSSSKSRKSDDSVKNDVLEQSDVPDDHEKEDIDETRDLTVPTSDPNDEVVEDTYQNVTVTVEDSDKDKENGDSDVCEIDINEIRYSEEPKDNLSNTYNDNTETKSAKHGADVGGAVEVPYDIDKSIDQNNIDKVKDNEERQTMPGHKTSDNSDSSSSSGDDDPKSKHTSSIGPVVLVSNRSEPTHVDEEVTDAVPGISGNVIGLNVIGETDDSVDSGQKQDNDALQRPKSTSLSESDITGDSVSVASTASHLSGGYNFGNESPESRSSTPQGERSEEEDVDEIVEAVILAANNSAETAASSIDPIPDTIDAVPVTDSNDKEPQIEKKLDLAVPSHDSLDTGSKHQVNLDTSSLSSLEGSALDTSIDLSSASSDSPATPRRRSPSPKPKSQPKKVAAPVFNMDDDDDDDDVDSDSSDSDDDVVRKRAPQMSVSTMPGIDEESDDSDEGQSRSYSFGNAGSDSDDEGRQFTEDDLLSELSGELDVLNNSTGSSSKTMSPAMFVFDENKDDDMDV